MRDLTRELGLGACCGKCVPEARKVLSNVLAAGTARDHALAAGEGSAGLLVAALG
jgi:bacterioferritin-associated ferredoxin